MLAMLPRNFMLKTGKKVAYTINSSGMYKAELAQKSLSNQAIRV